MTRSRPPAPTPGPQAGTWRALGEGSLVGGWVTNRPARAQLWPGLTLLATEGPMGKCRGPGFPAASLFQGASILQTRWKPQVTMHRSCLKDARRRDSVCKECPPGASRPPWTPDSDYWPLPPSAHSEPPLPPASTAALRVLRLNIHVLKKHG